MFGGGQSCLAVQHMLGCCRTAVVPGWCGRFSAHGRSGRNVPWFRGSLSGIRGFGGVLPSAVFKGDFHEPRISNVPVGTISVRTPDSRKLPRRIRENRHEPGNPDSSPTSSTHHRPNPSLPLPPPTPTVIQRQQTLLTTLTVTPASTNAAAGTDSRLNVGRRFRRHRNHLNVNKRLYRHSQLPNVGGRFRRH